MVEIDRLSAGFVMRRMGRLMTPDPTDERQRLGVFNPAAARAEDGSLYLFPRLAAPGNYSRVGRGRVLYNGGGEPVGVGDLEIALEPTEAWERHAGGGGVEDPRITHVPALGRWLMTYVAYGPFGGRIGVAVSSDLARWERIGPVAFGYTPELGTDLNLYSNKDAVFFPEPVAGPDGRPSLAMLHRPTWDLSWLVAGEGAPLPRGVEDARPGIWVSYVALDEVKADLSRLTYLTGHRQVALPMSDWEHVKIGAGAPPVRAPDGWLLVYHGVSGTTSHEWPQRDVTYRAGLMILDADDVSVVRYRSPVPLLEPTEPDERRGVVDNVVFPTAIDPRADDSADVYYGMADRCIGVARLYREPTVPPTT